MTFQIDKSTCLSYNNALNDFGYKGVSSNALRDMLDDIQNDYAVDIEVEIQPTHTFDFNAQDALYHPELKRLLRQEGLPRGDNDLKNKFQDAVNKISLDSIQRGFIRAYSKNEEESEDSSLIPDSLEGWYEDDISSDEDVTDDINVDSEEIHTDDE